MAGPVKSKCERAIERATCSYLGGASKISGTLIFKDVARIDGQVDGEIFSTDQVILGATAEVAARIEAPTVVVSGELIGQIKARRIEIHAKAEVVADLSSSILVVEAGAVVDGHCAMSQLSSEAHRSSEEETTEFNEEITHQAEEPSREEVPFDPRKRQGADLKADNYDGAVIDETPVVGAIENCASSVAAIYPTQPMRPGRRLPPTVAWLVISTFGGTFLGALLTFIVLDLLASFIDKFDDLMSYGLFREAGLEYLLLKLPLMTTQLIPVACLAGVLLGLAMLNRSGELLALQGLGISRLGIALPLLLISVVLSGVTFGLNETIVPAATRRSKYLLDGVIHHDAQYNVYAAQSWLRTRDTFVGIKNYDALRKRLLGLRIFQIGPLYTLNAIYSADYADWNGKEWIFSKLKVLDLKHRGALAAAESPNFHLDARPDDFSVPILSPEEFSLSELDAYIAKLRRNGLDPGSYFVDRDVKFALPLSCLVMMFCGLVLSLDPVPRASSAGRGFVLGLGLGVAYWITLGFTISFGRSGVMAPWLAAWLANLLFCLLGTALFLAGEER
jgi:lipopolysaccharide export system permease protein